MNQQAASEPQRERSCYPCPDCDPNGDGDPGSDSCTKCDGTSLLPACEGCENRGTYGNHYTGGIRYCDCRIGSAMKDLR
jgi:hypothetical protein